MLARWPTFFKPRILADCKNLHSNSAIKTSLSLRFETFLSSLEPGQPFLLCVGEQKNNIQRFYVIVDHKAIPCKGQTSMAAFDELFQAHFIFSVNYHESLNSFYTFIQTTVFNIDIGSAKESPRLPESKNSEQGFCTLISEVIYITRCKYADLFYL
ncbi:hypothetical protein NQZ68_015987 [Dissostichus eleginoides]|nr:hypothetical protein NQZ68_015987 [Dissostichus eleginoides]